MGTDSGKTKAKRTRAITLWVVVLVVCLAGVGCGGWRLYNVMHTISEPDNPHQVIPSIPEQQPAPDKLADNPIDFTSLINDNPDVCCWIYIPGTEVNHPILQHASDDSYYLDHDVHGDYDQRGSVYMELCNNRDLSDPVTILYGHNWVGGQMFSTLHYFEDPEFFEQNRKMYVYAPGHIYTYEVVSAYTTDDMHLMYRYNSFSTPEDRETFHADMLNPHSISENVHAMELDADDKVIVLSTCNTGALSEFGRYLVCGVMVDDQQTR